MQKSRVELALQKRRLGYNCCQALVCTYCDLFGIKEEDMFRISEGLGLGLSGLRETCGAVVGMMILAGLSRSDANLEKPATKRETYTIGAEMSEAFREKNSSIICRELKGKKLRSCNGCIIDAARLTEEFLFPGEFEPYDGEELE